MANTQRWTQLTPGTRRLTSPHLASQCPWTGRCIGKRNIRTFYIFLFSLLFHIIYVIIALNVHVANHNGDRARLRHQGQSHHRVQVRP